MWGVNRLAWRLPLGADVQNLTVISRSQRASLASLQPGATFYLAKCFSQEDIDQFTSLTGDSNPIHRAANPPVEPSGRPAATKDAAAPSSSVVPGILTASLFPAIIGSNFQGALYLSQTLRFKSSVLVRAPPPSHPAEPFFFRNTT
jgi:acyl dehydratase